MKLGVIGGLGPMATACFLEMITKMTEAQCDQDHLEILIHSAPYIPDRTAFILGRSKDSPVEPMLKIGKKLAKEVSCIAIPCITAHYFYRELSENIPAPIIHGIYETGLELQKNGIKRAGLMATDGTIESRIFQDQLEKMGIEVLANLGTIDMEKFQKVSLQLKDQGAQVILLGCTELSLIKKDVPLGKEYLDALEVLAQRCVVRCGKKLKKEYENLLMPEE